MQQCLDGGICIKPDCLVYSRLLIIYAHILPNDFGRLLYVACVNICLIQDSEELEYGNQSSHWRLIWLSNLNVYTEHINIYSMMRLLNHPTIDDDTDIDHLLSLPTTAGIFGVGPAFQAKLVTGHERFCRR